MVNVKSQSWGFYSLALFFVTFSVSQKIQILQIMLTIPLPYSATETQECVVKKLSDSWLFLFEMLSNNYMKVKSSKNHLLMSRKSDNRN